MTHVGLAAVYVLYIHLLVLLLYVYFTYTYNSKPFLTSILTAGEFINSMSEHDHISWFGAYI